VSKGGIAINGVLSGVTGVDYDDEDAWMATAAQIQVPSESGYTTYRYLNDGYDLVKDDGTTAAGWCDGSGNLVDAEITPGVAMWFKSIPGDATATVAGAVPEESSKTVDCPESFSLRANVFPIAITLNTDDMTSPDIVGVDYDDEDAWMATAAQIQVPSENGYTTYRYLNDGYDLEKDDGTTAPGWCDGSGNLVKDVIPAGQGFWTKGTSGAFTLNFKK